MAMARRIAAGLWALALTGLFACGGDGPAEPADGGRDAGRRDGGADASLEDGASSDGAGGADAGPDGGRSDDAGTEDSGTVGTDPVVVAVGDLACNCDGYCNAGYACAEQGVGALIEAMDPAPRWVIAVGDLQYENARYSDFTGTTASSCTSCPSEWGFDAFFGALRPRLKPVLGNHEYNGSPPDDYVRDNYFRYVDPGGTGQFGDPAHGYYAFDVPTTGEPWRVIVLNTGKCHDADPSFCAAGSEQLTWLEDELTDPEKRHTCTLAVFHHAYYTSGDAHCDPRLDRLYPIWHLLHDNGVDLVVNGHDHDYERFEPQDEHGVRDDAAGIVEMVVGTGGRNTAYVRNSVQTCSTRTFDGSDDSPNRNSALRVGSNGVNNDRSPCPSGGCDGRIFGVMSLTLHPASFTYQYLRTADSNVSTFADETPATVVCH